MNREREFEKIYNEYYPKILSYLRKRVANYQDAEDLAQEVMVAGYTNFDKYDPAKASVGTWIYVITGNRLKNYYRDKKTFCSLEEEWMLEIDGENYAEQAIMFEELRNLLVCAVKTLSPREQELVRARYFQRKSGQEVADELNMTPGNVRTALSRAIAKIRIYFQQNGY